MKEFVKVGHGGASSLAPPNTWRSFVLALMHGVDMIEVDLRRCGDGHLVLIHDPVIRHGGRELKVSDTSLPDLRATMRELGAPLVTLLEFLEFARGQCKVMIDVKEDGLADEMVSILRDVDIPKYDLVVSGASAGERRRLRELMPDISLSTTMELRPEDVTDDLIRGIDTPMVTWHYGMLTKESVKRVKERGIKIFAWTVDDLALMRELLHLGVDGIISGRPDLFSKL